jgi:hypothetical protein
VGEKPQKDREDDANHDARHDWEIKSGVFAAMNDVARKTAEAKRQFTTEVKKTADDGQESPKEQKRAAEIAKGIHARIIEEQTPASIVSKCVADGMSPALFSGEKLSGISLPLQKRKSTPSLQFDARASSVY